MSDTLSALNEERDYLLASLRRLDEERAAGALDDHEYRALHDEQTLRAAEVLRRIDAQRPATQTSEANSPRRAARSLQPKWAAAILVFVLVAGGTLIAATDSRQAGQTTTGNLAADTNTLLRSAQDRTSQGEPAAALKIYDQVLALDPKNVEALAYRGWLIRLAGLPNEGLKSIDQAISLDSKYPDAHFFRGLILLRDRQAAADAVPEFEAYLANNPPPDMVGLVQQALDDARAQAKVAKP